MKKFCSFVLAFILLFTVATVASAAPDETYYLADLEMSIDIPTDYVVFTRDVADDDPNLATYGLIRADLMDLMESRNIYLNAWDADINFEIVVTKIDSTISDFNLFSDTTLNAFASSLEDGYESVGLNVEKYELYYHDQAKFFKVYIDQPNGEDITHGLQYYTVFDNKAINVTMQSYSGEIDSNKESILESIVNTVRFDKEPVVAASSLETEAFVYRDEDAGIEFTVPANWTQEPLSQERETIDVKFTSNQDTGLSILYGSADIWAEMSSSEKTGLSRADADNSVFDEIAEAMGIAKDKISTVLYGGKEYYQYVNIASSSIFGIDLEITTTCLMRLENGYLYTFQFSGESDNPCYEDFESLLESVEYSVATNDLTSHSEESTESALSSKYENVESLTEVVGYPEPETTIPAPVSKSGIGGIFLSLLITIIIYSVPIIIYRYAIAKHPIEEARAKKLTIIYGIIAFIIMSILIFATSGNGVAGGAILLWSWVNYKILTSGRDSLAIDLATGASEATVENKPVVVPTPTTGPAEAVKMKPDELSETKGSAKPTSRKIMYCRHCGTKLIEGSKFCNHCGIKIEEESEH